MSEPETERKPLETRVESGKVYLSNVPQEERKPPSKLKTRPSFRERLRGASGKFVSGSRRAGAATYKGASFAGRKTVSGARRAKQTETARSFGIAGRAIGRYGAYRVYHKPRKRFKRKVARKLGKDFIKILTQETSKAQRKQLIRELQKANR